MATDSYYICEYGLIRCKDDYAELKDTVNEIYLPKASFENLYNYILENQASVPDGDLPFALFSRGSKRQIRVKNYVGIIETKDGLHLEILPKIHFQKTADEVSATKAIFLKMLRHLKNAPFIHINEAHLNAQKDFPILEVFIRSFILEAEKLINAGLRSDYLLEESNLSYLRGKLKVNQNIKYNYFNKAHFYCAYTEYSANIPPNKLIKTTLVKLLSHTKSYKSYLAINKLLLHLEEINVSTEIDKDLAVSNSQNRLFSKYATLLKWAEIFLKNKAFTNFKGSHVNMAILFPMERIFEDYIAHLFTKYADGYKIKAQDKSYFLVERHVDAGRFRLKPDLLVDSEVSRRIIVDTKWKLIDQFAPNKNYNISQADMYQLYAYGRKYTTGQEPKLVLLYPCNENFTHKLEQFIYEGELQLEVVPFDFEKDEKRQIESLLLMAE